MDQKCPQPPTTITTRSPDPLITRQSSLKLSTVIPRGLETFGLSVAHIQHGGVDRNVWNAAGGGPSVQGLITLLPNRELAGQAPGVSPPKAHVIIRHGETLSAGQSFQLRVFLLELLI